MATALAGCVGFAGTDTSEGTDGPEPPWTTEQLAPLAEEEIGDDGALVLYAGTGDFKPWEQIGDILAQEYPWFDIEGFAGRGGEVSQRVIQEHQAGRSEVDVVSQGDELLMDDELRTEIYPSTHDENYWFAHEASLEDYSSPWFASPLNGGPSVALGINPIELEKRNLDVPDSWNDLLEPQYEDVPVIFPQEPNLKRFGWIVSYHAEQKGLEPAEWFEKQVEHLDLEIVSSHTPGARFLGQGVTPLMHHNYPWVLRRFVEDLNVEVHFPDPVPMFLSSGIVTKYINSSNPWTARFFISVLMEEWVQKKIALEVDQFGPGRLDIDYSGIGLDEYTERTLAASVELIGWEAEQKYKTLSEDVYQKVLGQPAVDLE